MAAVSYMLTAPIGGWNTRDPLDQMPASDAITLENLFPNLGFITARNGYREHANGMGSSPVQTVAEFNSPAGVRKLIACTNGKIYDATTYGAAATQLGTGFTNNKWQWVNFRGTGGSNLIMVNGVDQPQKYDGTTLSNAAYTGVADDNKLVQVVVFKQRLYFVELDTTSIWYGGVNNITGALTQFDVGSFFQRGGYIQFIASWTRDSGSGPSDYLVIVSSLGEILVYGGDNPGAVGWSIIGRFYLPIPMGRRSYCYVGPDLVILAETGLFRMSEIMQLGTITGGESNISSKIDDAFTDASSLYSANFGWQVINYPRGHYLFANIPRQDSAVSDQYVVNSLTGSWCKFTGQNASSWTLYKEKPYFGGMDGKVYEADYGHTDASASISINMRQAYNYFDDRASQKMFEMARPIINTSSSISLAIGLDVDFQNQKFTNLLTSTVSGVGVWDSSTWNSASWDVSARTLSEIHSITGIGRAGSLVLQGNIINSSFSLSATQIVYQPGGIL